MTVPRSKHVSSPEPDIQELNLLEHSLGFLLNKLAIRVKLSFEEELAPLGLGSREFGVLVAISGSRSLSQQDIGAALGIDRSTMVSLADRLEELQAAQRKRDPKDRRVQVLAITRKGRKLLEQGKEILRHSEAECLSSLSKERSKKLLATLLDLYKQA